jgi:RNA polymerase sigma factor (sigma-70 family)
MSEAPLADLVRDATAGDQTAWDELVRRFSGLVWHVARGHRLDAADAADVSQTVWLRLVEHLGQLREPQALAGWLATTTRHESLRVLRRSGRELPDDGAGFTLAQRPSDEPAPDARLLREETHVVVWKALATLTPRCQVLLRALASTAESSYAEISEALEIPVGSIGPTRSRCLTQLRRALSALGLASAND